MTSTHTIVQLLVRAEELPSRAKDGVVVNLTPTAESRSSLKDLGETEVISGTVSPTFQTRFDVPYFFEMKQELLVRVLTKGRDGGKCLLEPSFTMAELMTAKKSTLELKSGKTTIFVSATMVGRTKGTLELTLRAVDLKKMNMFSKTSAYLEISHVMPSGQKTVVHRTETVLKSLAPQWKPLPRLDLVDLCGSEGSAKAIAFDVFNESSGKPEPMGGFVVSAEELMKGSGQNYELKYTDPKKNKEKSFGFVAIDRCTYMKAYDFLEYLQAGMEINIAFSIDFTSSNGRQTDRRSLHYSDPSQPNNYVRAILAVSNVVQEYDSDRQFPVFGFGAIAPFTQGTSHFFPLNGNPQNAYCNGMQQVVDTYAALLPNLQFSGPTNFAPTISTLTKGARDAKGVYTILLILTDGAITDMQDTLDAIVDADDAPLSIIIIGIGEADFSSMIRLDGDDEPLVDRHGRVTRRDLVQFVPFEEFKSHPSEVLAAEVLEEVPRQVEVWGRIANIAPKSFSK